MVHRVITGDTVFSGQKLRHAGVALNHATDTQSIHHGGRYNVRIRKVAVHNIRAELLNSLLQRGKGSLKTVVGAKFSLDDGDAQFLKAARELTFGCENHQVKAGEPGTCHIDNVPSYSTKIGNRNDPQGSGKSV